MEHLRFLYLNDTSNYYRPLANSHNFIATRRSRTEALFLLQTIGAVCSTSAGVDFWRIASHTQPIPPDPGRHSNRCWPTHTIPNFTLSKWIKFCRFRLGRIIRKIDLYCISTADLLPYPQHSFVGLLSCHTPRHMRVYSLMNLEWSKTRRRYLWPFLTWTGTKQADTDYLIVAIWDH